MWLVYLTCCVDVSFRERERRPVDDHTPGQRREAVGHLVCGSAEGADHQAARVSDVARQSRQAEEGALR